MGLLYLRKMKRTSVLRRKMPLSDENKLQHRTASGVRVDMPEQTSGVSVALSRMTHKYGHRLPYLNLCCLTVSQ